jgi:uncharacterized membrane protein
MKKNILIFIFSLCILALSVIILSIGPITNKKIGENWGYQNCDIISDQIDILNEDTEKLKKMDSLCRREKAMYDLEYCAFIINIIVSFICADLALLQHMEISKDFEIKAGFIAFISGIIGFILTLVYICYSGYIFTNDIAYMKLNINYGDFNFNTGKAIEKLYSNGASLKWDGYNFIPEYYNDRDAFSQFIKYKDLGKSQYNYDSEYYKKYQGYIDVNGEIYHCHSAQNDCQYVYKEPETENTNKELYDRWISSIILACFTLVCNLGVGIFGFFIFTNICNF